MDKKPTYPEPVIGSLESFSIKADNFGSESIHRFERIVSDITLFGGVCITAGRLIVINGPLEVYSRVKITFLVDGSIEIENLDAPKEKLS